MTLTLSLTKKNCGFFSSFYLDIDFVQRITNHPVHILDLNDKINPSAFIPFCGIGLNMSSMGLLINQFSFPICKSFRALKDISVFKMKVEKTFQKPLDRQIFEGVMIGQSDRRDHLLNSNAQFHAPAVARVRMTREIGL